MDIIVDVRSRAYTCVCPQEIHSVISTNNLLEKDNFWTNHFTIFFADLSLFFSSLSIHVFEPASSQILTFFFIRK
jgi:hypothetical protein